MDDAKVKRENTIREAKINIILDAARLVFSQSGFHDARLEDIAATAGFSKASLYTYYEDKESIFLSLAIREYSKVIDALKEITNSDENFTQKAQQCIESIFKMFGEHFGIFLTISNFMSMNMVNIQKLCLQHEKQATHFKQLHSEIARLFIDLIKSAREKGEIVSKLSDEIIAKYLGSLIRGTLFEWKMAGKLGDWQKEVSQIIEFITYGVSSTKIKQ